MTIKSLKIKNINIHFWILFNLAICAIMNDYMVYISGIEYGISLGISTVFLITLNTILIKKKIIILKSDFEWFDIVFIVLVLILAIVRIAIPETLYDTVNYHIYLQENIKIDKINFDFFAAKTVNGFIFPLGDRIHYIARFLLGYRLGTIISYYSIIVIFYQFKNILNHITGHRKLNSFFSMLCWSSVILMSWTGSYYIDIFSVVFSLEIIKFLLLEEDCFAEKSKVLILAILTGILTAIKLPNLTLIFPAFMIFIIKRRKQFKLKNIQIYLIAVLIFIIPFGIYIFDNVIQTGSPLYPYYNNIFKSEYFGNYSWVEPRFGIPNWKYKLIWPIYTSLSKNGYGDDVPVVDPIWAIGYVVTLMYIIYRAIHRKSDNKEMLLISIIAILTTFFWIEFLYGYMRYALIIPILYSIIIAVLLSKLAYFIREKYFYFTSKLAFSIFFVICSIMVITISILDKMLEIDMNQLFENYKLAFKDRGGITIHIDGVWGITDDDCALAQMLREDGVPIYNLQRELFDSCDKTKSMYNEILEKQENIYILIDKYKLDDGIKALEHDGFEAELTDVYKSDEIPYLEKNNVLYVFKIRK